MPVYLDSTLKEKKRKLENSGAEFIVAVTGLVIFNFWQTETLGHNQVTPKLYYNAQLMTLLCYRALTSTPEEMNLFQHYEQSRELSNILTTSTHRSTGVFNSLRGPEMNRA